MTFRQCSCCVAVWLQSSKHVTVMSVTFTFTHIPVTIAKGSHKAGEIQGRDEHHGGVHTGHRRDR